MKMSECEHHQSELIRKREIDYSCEDEVKFLIEDICLDCGKLLGKEIHPFKFCNRESVK